MSIAYFDCFAGVSGNMILGALIDAGLELEELRSTLAHIALPGYTLTACPVHRKGLQGTLVTVETQEEKTTRHLQDIEKLIGESDLPATVIERSLAIFHRLAEAEAAVHGTSVEEVHFHEVGAVDAIVDIVGAVSGLELLEVERVYASPVHIGRGTVQCAHGTLPVPAPATLQLLRGVPIYGRDIDSELTTPTGAAILTTLAESFGSAPPMRVTRIGYGAGTRELPIPELLRVSIGPATVSTTEYEQDTVTLIETNIDDMNPEWYEHVVERLFEAAALDVFLTPIQMKHGRPAVRLTAIVAEENVPQTLEILFTETTTLGVRFHSVWRYKLAREEIVVQTRYGPIRAKVARRGGTVINVAPEHRDCQRIARELAMPLKDVVQTAQEAARAAARDQADE